MSGNKNLFCKLDESVKGSISFGDQTKVPIMGKGDILIRLKNGDHQFVSHVYYVPALKTNILSIGQLLEKGYEIEMSKNGLVMRNGKGKMIAKVPLSKNKMFKLKLNADCAKCLKASTIDSSWLWHLRMGHLNFGGLELLSKKGLVHGLPFISHPNQICEGCMYGKQSRKSFPKESFSRASQPLGLVHADICGPLEPISYGKSRYFLLFIDDYTRKTWVYFLKEKSEAFEVFKKFKARVEKESGYSIKAIRTDRGGEFTSNKFNQFCEYLGVKHSLTIPRSPQQNGVVERKNRTILNMARSMLKSKRMPKEFWAEAVACAVYVNNRSPAKKLMQMTPQEAWSGWRPNISHLRVFGSIGYVHVPDETRSKLDDKSEKLVFVGYAENSKGYKFYNPQNGKIVISRDVEFHEEGSWEWDVPQDENHNFLSLFDEFGFKEHFID